MLLRVAPFLWLRLFWDLGKFEMSWPSLNLYPHVEQYASGSHQGGHYSLFSVVLVLLLGWLLGWLRRPFVDSIWVVNFLLVAARSTLAFVRDMLVFVRLLIDSAKASMVSLFTVAANARVSNDSVWWLFCTLRCVP